MALDKSQFCGWTMIQWALVFGFYNANENITVDEGIDLQSKWLSQFGFDGPSEHPVIVSVSNEDLRPKKIKIAARFFRDAAIRHGL